MILLLQLFTINEKILTQNQILMKQFEMILLLNGIGKKINNPSPYRELPLVLKEGGRRPDGLFLFYKTT